MRLIRNILKNDICRQFVKFCFVGLGNTIIDYTVYLFLSRILGFYFLLANAIALLAAMSFSFLLNKYWTFRNKEKNIKVQSFKFALVNLVYFFLNNFIVFSLVHYLQFFDLLAKIIAIIIGLIWNFLANRYWTFRPKA